MDLQQPGPGHGRRLHWRLSERKAFGAIWPPGMMGTRGLAAAAGARAAPSTISTSSLSTARRPSLTEPCPVSPGEKHGHRQPGRHRAAFERRVRCALAGTLPGPSCGFLTGVKETGTDKAMLAGATLGTTLTRPLLPAVVQMCRTFQKSGVTGVVRPCRAACPRASPKRATPGWRKRRRSRARRVQARSLTPALRVDPSRRRRRPDHGGG